MANSSKAKGDQAEREGVTALVEMAGDLVDVHKAQRLLGAGRKEDESDLLVFSDVAIQVKFWPADIPASLRKSATGAAEQAVNGNKPLGVGLVKFPNARSGSVRWLACVVDETCWPGGTIDAPIHDFAMVGRLLTWMRTDTAPYGFLAHPREQRFARLTSGAQPVVVAPLEAWLAAFRAYRGQLASVSRIA